jgi:hypothetical protein
VAAEANVGNAVAAGHTFWQRVLALVAKVDQVGVPVQRVVIDDDPAVEAAEGAIATNDQRVGLHQRGIHVVEGPVQAQCDGHKIVVPLARETDFVGQSPHLVGAQTEEWLDWHAGNTLRRVVRDLGNLEAPFCRSNEQRLGARPIELDPKIGLLLDIDRLIDQHLFHRIASDLHAEHLPGEAPRRVGVICEPDPSRLATPAGQHLCLEHDALPNAIRNPVNLIDRTCHVSGWHRDTVAPQDLLGLILV